MKLQEHRGLSSPEGGVRKCSLLKQNLPQDSALLWHFSRICLGYAMLTRQGNIAGPLLDASLLQRLKKLNSDVLLDVH